MFDNDFLRYLVVTDQIDEFLGNDLSSEIKELLLEIVKEYKNNNISEDEVINYLNQVHKKYKVSNKLLLDYFNNNLD